MCPSKPSGAWESICDPKRSDEERIAAFADLMTATDGWWNTDRAPKATLYEYILARSWKIARAMLGNQAELVADDLANEAAMILYDKAPEIEKPKSYLDGILRNLSRQAIKRFQSDRELQSIDALPEDVLMVLPDCLEDEPDRVEAPRDPRRIRAFFEKFPRRERDVLHLHYVDGKNYHEIAKKLGIRQDAARKALSRARKRANDNLNGGV